MVFILKKVFYRIAGLCYLLSKSPLKKWPAIFAKTHKQVLLETIILRYDGKGKFQEEIDFLKEQKKLTVFPYKNIKQLENIDSGYDSVKNLPYVIHKGRKLYFVRSWSEKNLPEHTKILSKTRIF
jgi:hypothetical protein